MVHVEKYRLPPTTLIPNSPLPLLHYPGLLTSQTAHADAPVRIHDLFAHNGWQVQWIYRYGPTQDAHYHSAAHEAMAVLSGEATIRFGASDQAEALFLSKEEESSPGYYVAPTSCSADTTASPSSSSSRSSRRRSSHGGGGGGGASPLELHARTGDVFILPAGVAHKTFNTGPLSSAKGMKLLTPGDGHRVVTSEGQDPRTSLAEVELDGFTMIGAYPLGGGEWDFNVGGEHQGKYGEVWKVARPERDPVLGDDPTGLCGLW